MRWDTGDAELDQRFTNNRPREFRRVRIRRARSALTTPRTHSEISKKIAHLAARRGCDNTFCFSDRYSTTKAITSKKTLTLM
jgi:hypothetical protein